jgi:hypothetical protein
MKNEVQRKKQIDPIVKYYSRVPNKILNTFILFDDFFQNSYLCLSLFVLDVSY